MSREQLVIASILFFFIVVGIPAFFVPGTTGSAINNSGESGQKSGEQYDIKSEPTPKTVLNLTKTSKEQRKKIRRRRKVNINTADSEALVTLPGIGPNRAEDILKYRNDDNKFHNVNDLKEIDGFGDKSAEKLDESIKYGEKFYKEPAESGGKIDVNEASVSRLKKLKGVGTATANDIVKYREQNGGIGTYSELDKIDGIGPATIENLSDQLKGLDGSPTATDGMGSSENGSSTVGSININEAGKTTLEKLPGVGPATADSILQYRRNNGGFSSVDELDEVSGIGPATLEDIRPKATAE